jgi:hypothetical protein
MKKPWILLAIGMVLCGCAVEDTLETVADEMVQQVMAEPKEVLLTLPEEAVLPAMESENGVLYICREFDVSVQTLEGGDFSKTLQTISGYSPEELTVVQTINGDCTRYDFVWTSAGELGEQVCRGCILDDGTYHYSVTAMTDAAMYEEYREIWNGMFETLGLS